MSEAPRRLQRERAISLLYEAEIKGVSIDSVLASLPAAPDEFVVEIVEGVDAKSCDLDQLISRFSRDWPLERLATLDRTIMRIGVWELINRPELPVAVVISEAVELAKHFSTEESGSFVNGILASIATDQGR